MAARRINPTSRASARPVQRGAEVKEAAKNAPAGDDDRTYTHQGPGTGQAGAADPKASAAILNSGKGAASTAEAKAAATVVESKSAPVEAAGEAIRERLAEERLKLGASGDDDTGTLPTPRTPGQQTGDSGTAGAGPGMGGGKTSSEAAAGGGSGSAASSSESSGSGTATSEGGRDPFGANTLTDRLDAATASALSQLDSARPNLRGGLDIFQSVTETSSTPAGSGSGHEDRLAAAAEGSKSVPGQAASDPGAEHAADVAGQVTGGRGSADSMFGDRLGDAKGELGIMAGLLGDAAAKESSPSVAEGTLDKVVGAVTGAGGVVGYISGGAGAAEAALAAGSVTATPVIAGVAAVGGGAYLATRKLDEATGAGDAVVDAAVGLNEPRHVEAMKAAIAERNRVEAQAERAAGQSTEPGQSNDADPNGQSTEPDPNGQSTEPTKGGGVGDPGDPNNPDGGMPTPAQIAFRQSLRQALGGAQTGSGDIDPADNGGAPVGGSNFAGAANDNLGLIGQPAGPGTGPGGTMRSPTTGTDVDPIEGSAYSGPALGGNPEDLQFGSETLPLESLPRSSSSDDDDSSEDSSSKDEDDDA